MKISMVAQQPHSIAHFVRAFSFRTFFLVGGFLCPVFVYAATPFIQLDYDTYDCSQANFFCFGTTTTSVVHSGATASQALNEGWGSSYSNVAFQYYDHSGGTQLFGPWVAQSAFYIDGPGVENLEIYPIFSSTLVGHSVQCHGGYIDCDLASGGTGLTENIVTLPLNEWFVLRSEWNPTFDENFISRLYINSNLVFQSNPFNPNLSNTYLNGLYASALALSLYDVYNDSNEIFFDDLPETPYIQYITSDFIGNAIFYPGFVYVISGEVEIPSGKTLTIEPGSIIKFDTATTSSLIVNGVLDVKEPGEHDVKLGGFFTSLKDDLIGEDTNGDMASTTPAAGDWGGIVVNSGGTANLPYSIIRYGGSVGGSNAMVHNNGGMLTMSSSTIAYGSGYGIRNSSGTTTIEKSDIAFNTHGLYVDDGTVNLVGTSTIHNNSAYGIYNDSTNTIQAEGNYCGDSSGPYHSSNTSGLGNAVSDYVDFTPWVGTSTLRFIIPDYDCPSATCASVRNDAIYYTASTTYTSELNAAVSVWNGLGSILIAPTSTVPNVHVADEIVPDVLWKGTWWRPEGHPSISDQIALNSYFLDNQSFNLRQHTIIHEFGHALGLNHSYVGNIMDRNQSTQTALGQQDTSDYYYLWP